jgi:hypothetical protein
VLHYVVAGFVGLFALFGLIHVAMGLGIVTGAFPFNHHPARGGRSSRPSSAGCSSDWG